MLRVLRLPRITSIGSWTAQRWTILVCCAIQWAACCWRLTANPALNRPPALPCAAGDPSCGSPQQTAAESAANCTDPAIFSGGATLQRKYSCASLWAASALLRVGGHGGEPQSHEERLVFVAALTLASAVALPYLLARAAVIRSILAASARDAGAGPQGLYLRDRLAPPPRESRWTARPDGGAPAGRGDWWRRVGEYAARHAAHAAERRRAGTGLAGDLHVLQSGGLTAALRVRAFLLVRDPPSLHRLPGRAGW